ncbi:MAG: MmgE/PrpD family protein [Candidatus Competibacteraceae bacterium]|nr:MmgE/PrpD family protein [Candidatus Competibacteraceae bacterium]
MLCSFIHEIRYQDLPPPVRAQAKRCLLDLLGVAAGGVTTSLSRIIRETTLEQFGVSAGGPRLLFDGRRSSPAGAALAGAMTLDALDAHDGHVLTKGHAGAALLPALLALVDGGRELDGRGLLTTLVVGYEVALRAGIALHRGACDYHTSGAWNALGVAAMGARLLDLDQAATAEALGIAEYHGPRSQMMRCIDHPTMVKDGSGWGAMAGVTAAYLARRGFTGAPAVTITDKEMAELWSDLGGRWRILEQYFKPYPVCRWAQPAVEAALSLARTHGLRARDVVRVQVASFHQAVRLAVREPRTTEQAQYSLPFAVAAALVRGRLGAAEVSEEAFADPEIRRLSRSMVLCELPAYNARFPGERWAHVHFGLRDGRMLQSEQYPARGNPENPLSDQELGEKYHTLAEPVLGGPRTRDLQAAVAALDRPGSGLAELFELLFRPVAGAVSGKDSKG